MTTQYARSLRVLGFAGLLYASQTAFAGQAHNATPAAATALPRLVYEIDYAVSSRTQTSSVTTQADTIVSIGLAGDPGTKCNVQVQWFDWDGTPAGFSGDNSSVISLLGPLQTLEFTTVPSTGMALAYPPFELNVFRNTSTVFEGHGAIRTDCPTSVKLRADAEFAITTIPATGGIGATDYKPINITALTGLKGY